MRHLLQTWSGAILVILCAGALLAVGTFVYPFFSSWMTARRDAELRQEAEKREIQMAAETERLLRTTAEKDLRLFTKQCQGMLSAITELARDPISDHFHHRRLCDFINLRLTAVSAMAAWLKNSKFFDSEDDAWRIYQTTIKQLVQELKQAKNRLNVGETLLESVP